MKSLRAALTLCLLTLLLAAPAVSRAQQRQPMPELISQGLNSYAQSGLTTALQVWLQNSLLDRNTLLRGELAALVKADANYGMFESGEVLQIAVITPRISRVYLVMYYERAPVWAWFELYRTRSGNQVISDVFFSTKAQVILPAQFTD